MRVLGYSGASDLGGVVEADEKFFRGHRRGLLRLKTLHSRVFSASQTICEARKGSREWVRHQRDPSHHPKPDRMRWVGPNDRSK